MSLGIGLKRKIEEKSPAIWTPAAFGSNLKLWLESGYGMYGVNGLPPNSGTELGIWTDKSKVGGNNARGSITTAVVDGNVEEDTEINIAEVNSNIYIGMYVTGLGIETTPRVSNVDGVTITLDSTVTVEEGVTVTFTMHGFAWTISGDARYLSSSGTQIMQLPQFNIGGSTEFSLSFGIYFKNGTTINNADVFVNDQDTTSNDFWRIQNTTSLRAKIGGAATTFTINSATPGTSSGTLQDETWYNIIWTRNASNENRLWINNLKHGPNTRGGTFDFDRIVAGNGAIISAVIMTQGEAIGDNEYVISKINSYLDRINKATRL